MSERYVVAGLARARTQWFTRLGRMATEGAVPVEFVRCVSPAELRARLSSGRAFSAVVLGIEPGSTDRDLIAAVREAGAAPIVVADEVDRDWLALGAAAVLPTGFDREDLLATLAATAAAVGEVPTRPTPISEPDPEREGRLVAVTGPGGTGASTVAIALAQGLAAEPGGGAVLLADLRRVAEQAMLHDSRVVVPGLQELVEAHRTATPALQELIAQTFAVPTRGYRLLLGLRRPRHWTALRPRALDAALRSLRLAFTTVVADVDPDVEGEAETGSVDVEERHLAARLALGRADATIVVAEPSMKGLYAAARLLDDLTSFGVPPQRVLTVLNRAPRSRPRRAELTRAFGELLSDAAGERPYPSPVFLPSRGIEAALRDGVAIPQPLPRLLAAATTAVASTPRASVLAPSEPVPIAPGSLGLDPQEPS